MAETTVTVIGTTLFAVAAQQFGDATAWDQIATANGLSDPMVWSLTTLIIPDVTANAGNS